MIWIGGAPGAGKSTVARTIARRYDLPWHPIDLWTYDHVDRLPPESTLAEDLASGPALAAEAFVQYGRRRLPLVIADVRARELGEVPALVEGPQLTPYDAHSLPADHSVWLVPTTERTRAARQERMEKAGQDRPREWLQALLDRDAILASGLRDVAWALGLPLVLVGTPVDWAAVEDAVLDALEPALLAAVPLSPGEPLGRQRQFENLTACRQGRLWQRAEGIEQLPEFPFGCECGASGCSASRSARPDDYDHATAAGPLVATGHAALWGR